LGLTDLGVSTSMLDLVGWGDSRPPFVLRD